MARSTRVLRFDRRRHGVTCTRRSGMGVRVTNNAGKDWPTWLVRWLVRRACADAGITSYHWTQKSCGAGRGWWGRGGSNYGYGGVERRADAARSAWRPVIDPRFNGAPVEWVPMSSVATLAFLIRHEVAHARGAEGYPGDYAKLKGGKVDRASMEDACNEAAGRFVRALAADFPAVLAEWVRLARKARPAKVDRTAQTLDKHQAALDAWSRKLKIAQTKVKKYRGLVRTTQRRLAARSGKSANS